MRFQKAPQNNPVDRGYLQFELARIRNRRDRMKIGPQAFPCMTRLMRQAYNAGECRSEPRSNPCRDIEQVLCTQLLCNTTASAKAREFTSEVTCTCKKGDIKAQLNCSVLYSSMHAYLKITDINSGEGLTQWRVYLQAHQARAYGPQILGAPKDQ